MSIEFARKRFRALPWREARTRLWGACRRRVARLHPSRISHGTASCISFEPLHANEALPSTLSSTFLQRLRLSLLPPSFIYRVERSILPALEPFDRAAIHLRPEGKQDGSVRGACCSISSSTSSKTRANVSNLTMTTHAPMARVPFAPLDNPRLQHLASAKNRQNGVPMLPSRE